MKPVVRWRRWGDFWRVFWKVDCGGYVSEMSYPLGDSAVVDAEASITWCGNTQSPFAEYRRSLRVM